MAHDEKTAARVRKILAGRGDIAERQMMGGLSFMVGGNMACSVSGRGGMLVRVGPEAFDRVLTEPHARRAQMGAKIMTGFVRVDPDGYRTDAALRKWIQRGLDFVATVPATKAKSRRQ